ncbi:TPA: hypothetical protein QDB14_001045 [Burkholderia vietnamiensis]|nr:hypothetical protein [Burkholderia vietnamiensis]
MAVLTLLFGAVQLFGVSWIRSVQKKLEDSEARDVAIQRDNAAFREMVARDYVRRAEHQGQRDEFRDGLRDIDQKLTEINNKLDKKQDKQ